MRAVIAVLLLMIGLMLAGVAQADTGQVQRGEYLVRLGDCVACHTTRGGQAYAGGLEIRTGFGRIYTPNITPDRETGIGNWNADQFWNALHEGVAPDGSRYYPAFPYTNYSLVNRDDADAMFAYLRSLPPVRQANREQALEFPYGWRSLMAVWQQFYFRPQQFRDNPEQTPEWNRGAYLVNGLGHCTACHSRRNSWGAVTGDTAYAGAMVPGTSWYAPDLRERGATGLHDDDVDATVRLLKTGHSGQRGVTGPMAEVVNNSLQYATESDLRAMVVFLRSLPPRDVEKPSATMTAASRANFAARGKALYGEHCATCHGDNGEGVRDAFPRLAGNPAVTAREPANVLKMIMIGGFAVSTAGNPRPYSMPPFADRLGDDDVAAIATYLRGAFGNDAGAVTPAQVASQRGAF